MKTSALLAVLSVLSVLLFTFHLAGDILLGYEGGGLWNAIAFPILVLWLYGALALAGRRSGYIIMLLGSLLGCAVPLAHMRGKGLGGAVANHGASFFFVWAVIAIGVIAPLSVILSVQGLWSLRRRPQ
jgi:hypothetical protein